VPSARRLYGTSNEELMDNAKFKTIGGDADRASGILFNFKPNGDRLTVRYNDTENNVAIFEACIRRPVSPPGGEEVNEDSESIDLVRW
jgi:hypothetical protein